MKYLRLLLIIVISAIAFIEVSVAEKVTKEQALQVASDFFSKSTGRQLSQKLKILRTSDDFPKFATKSVNSNGPYIYIISVENDKGFVIVSGNDCAKPILGYSFDDTIDFSNIPDNFQYWLDFLSSQIKWAVENNISSTSTKQSWTNITKATVTKYLETASWSQNNPFNLQCPTVLGDRSISGCVPTALAEVMKYYKWPTKGVGTTEAYTFTCEYNKQSVEVEVPSRDLNHDYAWDKMPMTKGEYKTDEQKNAVSTLIADIGAACKATYSPDGTSAFTLQSCLIDNFGYSQNLIMEYRNQYSEIEWIKLLKSEIDKGRPLVYTGYDEEKNSGHAFVLDGYNSDDAFHVNWGWGGSYNSYFQISALNPISYKFNVNQNTLINFYPEDGVSKPAPSKWLCLCKTGLTGSYTSPTITIKKLIISISCPKVYNGTIRFKIVDRTGKIIENLTKTLSGSSLKPNSNYSWSNLTITLKESVIGNLKPGYRVRAYHKPEGYDEWYPLYREGASEKIGQEIILCEDAENYTITEAGYASLYSENNLVVPDGIEVYTYTYDDFSGALIPGNAITKDNIIPANTGYIIKGSQGTYKFNISTEEAGKYSSDLLGTLTEISTPKGQIYVLGEKSGKITFYKYIGKKISAGKVYFIKPDEE